MTDTRTIVAEAYADGLLVELVLTDGRDYSGYEVDLVTDEGFVITYGDYDDERTENAVIVRWDEVVDGELVLI